MNGIKINDYNHRKQYSALMEELSDRNDLKVSMSFGNEWIGYNEKSKNMYVVLELPTHLSDDYTSLCLVARAECGGAVIHYTATDEEGREEDFDDYEDLMEIHYKCGDCGFEDFEENFTREHDGTIICPCKEEEEEIDHADDYVEHCKAHLDGNFNQKCPHDEPKKEEPNASSINKKIEMELFNKSIAKTTKMESIKNINDYNHAGLPVELFLKLCKEQLKLVEKNGNQLKIGNSNLCYSCDKPYDEKLNCMNYNCPQYS